MIQKKKVKRRKGWQENAKKERKGKERGVERRGRKGEGGKSWIEQENVFLASNNRDNPPDTPDFLFDFDLRYILATIFFC